jgi:hypothetical protein
MKPGLKMNISNESPVVLRLAVGTFGKSDVLAINY